MFRLLKIFLIIGIITSSFAIQVDGNFTISYPESLQKNKTFQLSFITSAEYFNADQLQLIFAQGSGVNLRSAAINSLNGLTKFDLKKLRIEQFSEDVQQIIINLNDSSQIGNSFFQLLLEFDSGKEDETEFYFSGLLKKNGEVIDYLSSSDEKLISDIPGFFRIEFKFYEPVKSFDQCVKLIQNSTLTFPLDYKNEHKLFSEFWIKLDKSPQVFLKIKNSSSGRTEYQLSTNEFQMLIAESKHNFLSQIRPLFLSNKIWYHISALFDVEKKAIYFYCDGILFSVIEIPENTDHSEFVFEFSNSSPGSTFSIEQFRISDLSGDPDCMFSNRNYNTSSCENSKTVFQTSFMEIEINKMQSNSLLSFNNIRFIQSDAPIHLVVPELDVKILNNFFEIGFIARDNRNISEFIIEKSVDNREFIPEKSFVVENAEYKNYSCLVEKENESELVYFRLKLVNKDGSELYSSQVKIGQGLIEDIILGQNFPNPFNPETQIEFELLQEGEVEVTVFNVGGQEISNLHHGFLSEGLHQFKFDGSELPSGIYLVRVSTANFTLARKMILAK